VFSTENVLTKARPYNLSAANPAILTFYAIYFKIHYNNIFLLRVGLPSILQDVLFIAFHEHSSSHGMCRRMQAFYSIKNMCSGTRERTDVLHFVKIFA